jgi:hypothetical protein
VTSGGLFARNSQILALQVVDSSGPGIAYSALQLEICGGDKCPNSDAAPGTTEDGVSRHIGRHGSPPPRWRAESRERDEAVSGLLSFSAPAAALRDPCRRGRAMFGSAAPPIIRLPDV